ncbi:hypothetical protein EIP91_009654 [Steccherinum ochraceum]|uniref:AB hydrolase-1 domain-containing protein n=1 Tax=Steccherinum ochraceum TaxID=92696 RepID=A0A4R0R1E7_9APHY|nr:hypothetical protein EIP91_009654 [Steccherinum ochraceum]
MSAQEGRLVTSEDGTTIWAGDAGNKNGIPVVFIHGLSCTSTVFDLQFSDPKLLENLYLIRYELRGHGRSGYPATPEAYSGQRYAEDFMAVCKSFGLVKPFVCGWSLGALTPVDVAETFGPDQIAGVIYPGGPALTLELHAKYIHPTLQTLFGTAMSSDGNVLPEAANKFVDSVLYDPSIVPYGPRLQALAGFLIQPPSIRLLTVSRKVESGRWLKEFTSKPHLLVQGREDQHSVTEKLIPVAKETIPGIEIHVLEKVGHAVPIEGAAKLNELLLEFVQRHKKAWKA